MAQAQYWAPAGIAGSAVTLQEVYSTPNQDTLYYCGTLQLGGLDWYESNSVMRLTAQGWDTIGVVQGIVFTVVQWHDTLVVGGDFTSVNDDPFAHIAAYVGGEWISFGSFEDLGLRRLRVIDDELYAVGAFQTVDGDTAMGIAVRQGGEWHSVGNTSELEDPLLSDVTKYNDRLVVIGLMGTQDGRGIMQLIDSMWQLVGPGIQGGLSGAHSIMEYQGDLYVGGQLRLSEGNAGQDIMRWDGTQFNAVGLGLQGELGNTTTFSDCRSMQVHDGLLFVGGGFNYAGGVPARGIATWDGIEWCGVPGTLTEGTDYVKSLAFYSDTLFAACGWLADGDSVNQAAKFIGESYSDSCSGPVGFADYDPPPGLLAFRDTSTETIRVVVPERMTDGRVDLLDAIGRTVDHGFGTEVTFQTATLGAGLYFVRAEGFAPQRVLVE